MNAEQGNWKWWVGHDDERYHTECDTREEAVYIATEEQEGGCIVEAMKPNIKLSRFFDGYMFVENAEYDAHDEHGDPETGDPVFDLSTEQTKSLQDTVRAAIDAWQEENGLTFSGFMFAAARNHAYVPPRAADRAVQPS